MSGASGLRKHGHLSDGDGGTITAYSPHVVYAECNTSPTGTVNVPWDTFYDVHAITVADPAAAGLTYSGGLFTATGDGVWILSLGMDIVAAPGSTGNIFIAVPTFGYNPKILIASSGNPAIWETERTIAMLAGQTFRVIQTATGGVSLVNGYAVLEIYRVAAAVS